MPPNLKLLLTSFLGNGMQLLIVILIVCLLGTLDLFESHSKGDTKTVGIMAFAFCGIFNGYFSAKYYKYFGGKHWALNVIVSSCLFPVI